MESVIDELAPNFLGEGTINGNDNRVPYHLFVEAVEQAPMAISITDKKANILYVWSFPEIEKVSCCNYWVVTIFYRVCVECGKTYQIYLYMAGYPPKNWETSVYNEYNL